jgi:hypothetical protein
MKFILIVMIGSWISPDRIEFDTLEECEIAAEKLTYGKIVTACEIGEQYAGVSGNSDNISRPL